MPERFLLQILRSLVTHGILRSTRGVDGGYMLTRGPDEISLLEIIEAIDGPVATDLSTVERLPPWSHERLRQAFEYIADVARSQLDSIKLSDLLPPGGMHAHKVRQDDAHPRENGTEGTSEPGHGNGQGHEHRPRGAEHQTHAVD